MHTSPLLRLVCVSAGLWIGTTASAQQPSAAPDDPALQRVEQELGVDKIPPPRALTRGFRARGRTDAASPAPPPPTEPRKGFRIRGGATQARGGELPPESSPVLLSTPPSQSAPASPPPPPAVTVQEKQAQQVTVEAVELPAVKGSETQLDIQFVKNSTAYLDADEAAVQIARLAQVMGKRPDLRILVEGHCCDLGEAHHNNVLSCYRAEAVADHLARYLVAQDATGGLTFAQARARLDTIGFGETDPLRRVLPGDSADLALSKRLANRHARCRLAAPLP